MTKAKDIITPALRTIGVVPDGQIAQPEDESRALQKLNDRLDLWATDNLFAYTTNEYTYTLTGSATVTISPTGNIVATTPTNVHRGYIRVGDIDYGFEIVDYETWADIGQKSLPGTYPSVAYYDGNGTLHFYPVPSSGVLHLAILNRLAAFPNLTTDVSLPAGYKLALQLTLAEDLAPDYGRQLMPATLRQAISARAVIRRANTRIPRLFIPYRIEANGNALVTPPDADIYGGGNSSSI